MGDQNSCQSAPAAASLGAGDGAGDGDARGGSAAAGRLAMGLGAALTGARAGARSGVRLMNSGPARRAIQLEDADRHRQALRLLLQRLRRGGGFLHQRGVLLRHLVHLRDGLVDLLDAGGLLLAGRRDLAP